MTDEPRPEDGLNNDRTFLGEREEAPESTRSLGIEETRGDANDSSQDEFQQALGVFDEIVDLESRYDIQEELGAGGMGKVVKAVDKRLGRTVALKFLLEELGSSTSALARFLTEAKAIAMLNHFNIVQIYEMERCAEGPYIVMEYVEGGSLVDVLADGPMEMEKAVEIVSQVSDALVMAHQQGIIHRDIKPANILITTTGVPKLSDFGLARQDQTDHGQTQAGAVLGTLDFMPPEQRRDATSVDARSDLWSLAATLYQMVTGEVPRVIDLEDVPGALHPVLIKALKSKPDARYQSAAEFTEALKAVIAPSAMPLASMKDLRRGQCPGCQSINDVSRKFCERCGATLQVPCLSCKKEIGAWEAFCPECGCDTAEILEQQRQQFELQKDRIQDLRKKYCYEESLQLLEAITTVTQPQLSAFREWAEEMRTQCQQEQADQQQQCEQALTAADLAYREFNEKEAIRLLEQVPEPVRSDKAKEALAICRDHIERIDGLRSEIHDRIKSDKLSGLSGTVEAYLVLRPNDEPAQKLLEKLRTHDKENELEIVVDLGNAMLPPPGHDPTVSQALWAILKKYDTNGSNGLFITPNIPSQKLNTACLNCHVPHGEPILGLIDHTVFGSAKKCLLIGTQGIYFRNDWSSSVSGISGTFHVPYSDLVSYLIGVRKWGEIGIGDHLAISITGGKINIQTEIQLLQELKGFFRSDRNRLPDEDVIELVPRQLRPPSLLSEPPEDIEETEQTMIRIRNDVAQESPAPVAEKAMSYDGETVSGNLVLNQAGTYYIAAGRVLGPAEDGFFIFDSNCFGGEVVSGQAGDEVAVTISVSVTSGSWAIGVFRQMEDIPTADPAEWKGA